MNCLWTVTFVFASLGASTVWSCPPGAWINLNSTGFNCYLPVRNARMTWFQARQECINQGGDLAVFDTPAEMTAVNAILSPEDVSLNYWWIGLTDMFLDNSWVWLDPSQPATFFNWGNQQPNDGPGDQDCVCIDRNDGNRWHDSGCGNPSDSYPMVCEALQVF